MKRRESEEITMNVLCIFLRTSFSEEAYINKIIMKHDMRKEWHCAFQISNCKCNKMFANVIK